MKADRFPQTGAMDFIDVSGKLNCFPNLDVMRNSLINGPALGVDKVFPADFRGKIYFSIEGDAHISYRSDVLFCLFVVYGNYTITSNKSWAMLNVPTVDTVLYQATVTVNKNTSPYQRVATITLTSSILNKSYDFNVFQDGAPVAGKYPIILTNGFPTAAEACSGIQNQLLYIDSPDFATATKLYVNPTDDLFAFSGWYGFEDGKRKWTRTDPLNNPTGQFDTPLQVCNVFDNSNQLVIGFSVLPTGVDTLLEWSDYLGVDFEDYSVDGNEVTFEVSDTNQVSRIWWGHGNINAISGLSVFPNLAILIINEQISSIDISGNPLLNYVDLYFTDLTPMATDNMLITLESFNTWNGLFGIPDRTSTSDAAYSALLSRNWNIITRT